MSVTLAAYQDILYCSRPVSRHPKMSIENRAKLFTPFSALRGFDIEILTQEQDRLLVPQISLASDREEEIYRVLNGLHQGDWVTVSYFVPVKTIGGQILCLFPAHRHPAYPGRPEHGRPPGAPCPWTDLPQRPGRPVCRRGLS